MSGNRVSLAVEDSGPGIAPEERLQLFDRFHRATDQGNGAGLGLAIADSVVRATGGEWRVGRADWGGAHGGALAPFARSKRPGRRERHRKSLVLERPRTRRRSATLGRDWQEWDQD